MKTRTRILIMKLLSLTGVFAFLYPVVYVGRRLLFNTNGGFSSFAFFLVLLYSGLFAGLLIVKEESALFKKLSDFSLIDIISEKKADVKLVSTIVAYFTLVIPLASATAIFSGSGILRLLFELPVAFLIYFIGLRGYFKEYGDILSKHVMYTGAIIILFPVFIASVSSGWNGRPFIFGCAYAFIVISMVVRNQDTLDTLFLKKGVNMADAVKNVRGFNILVVVAVFTLTVLLFNFRDTVVFVLNSVSYLIKQVIRLIIKLMMLNPQPEGGEVPPPDEPPSFDGEEIIHPWLNFAGRVLKYFIIIFAAYKIIFMILFKSRSVLKRLSRFIKELFKRTLSFNIVETEDYSDEVETVKPVRAQSRIKLKSRARTARKDLRQISDPVEKVRYIYGAMLGMLVLKRIKISRSDTTGEIFKKAAQLEGMSGCFDDMTNLYGEVRYGDRIPGGSEVESYESRYDKAKKMLQKK